MAAPLLLDTVAASVLSPFKGTSSLRSKCAAAAVGRPLVLSVQTVAELYFWAETKNWGARRRAEVDAYIAGHAVIDCDAKLATAWAVVTKFSRAAGKPLASGDAWIAATALDYGLELLTSDKDFIDLKIPGLLVTCIA